jgi:hypothetical protein
LRAQRLRNLYRSSAAIELPFDPVAWRTGVISELTAAVDALGSDDELKDAVESAEAAVAAIEKDGRELEAFRGKSILKQFYDNRAKKAGLSFPAFVYDVARAARERPRLERLAGGAAIQIQSYVPVGLEAAVASVKAALTDEEAIEMAETARSLAAAARSDWEGRRPISTSMTALRSSIAKVVGGARAAGLEEQRTILVSEMAQIGLG